MIQNEWYLDLRRMVTNVTGTLQINLGFLACGLQTLGHLRTLQQHSEIVNLQHITTPS